MRKVTIAIVAVIIAAFAALTIPNLRLSYDRARQKRTMADMRSIGMALEAYASDCNPFPAPQSESFETMRGVSFGELERVLTPTYIRKLPRLDGWGNPIEVRVGTYDRDRAEQAIAIRSVGSDGRAESQSYTRGHTRNFRDDIVFTNGGFLRHPGDGCG